MICGNKQCNSENIISEWREERLQYLKRCKDCGKATWHPISDKKKNREASHKKLVKKIGIDFCQLCLIPEKILPARQFLEAHHVIEYVDDGTFDPQNIWILCTECHSKVHHIRTYKGHLIDKIMNNDRSTDSAA